MIIVTIHKREYIFIFEEYKQRTDIQIVLG